MDKTFSKQVLNSMEVALKQVAQDVCNEGRHYHDLENEVFQRVQRKMENLHTSLHFKLAIPRTTEIKSAKCKISPSKNGIIQGTITLEHCQNEIHSNMGDLVIRGGKTDNYVSIQKTRDNSTNGMLGLVNGKTFITHCIKASSKNKAYGTN